jgi:two-component system alkaline phosphatase synthesis response regulator PhoP
MLPGMDGLKVCSQLRKDANKKDIPIIMLTAKSEDEDIIKGLESGADDYITKPFSPRILVARVKSALRRSSHDVSDHEANRISIHDLVIDTARHEILLAGEPIILSATEFGILQFLAKNPGWVFSRNQIIDFVKGEDYPVTARSVDVQILGIRKKLGERGNIIETVRGIGYRMKGE